MLLARQAGRAGVYTCHLCVPRVCLATEDINADPLSGASDPVNQRQISQGHEDKGGQGKLPQKLRADLERTWEGTTAQESDGRGSQKHVAEGQRTLHGVHRETAPVPQGRSQFPGGVQPERKAVK